jgi:CheY-like chemotaxis protein
MLKDAMTIESRRDGSLSPATAPWISISTGSPLLSGSSDSLESCIVSYINLIEGDSRSDGEIMTSSDYILAAVDDLIFVSRIKAVAESLGMELAFARNFDDVLAASRARAPRLVLADLHSEAIRPFAVAEAIKNDPKLSSVRLIGFFSHVDTSLRARALQAGFDAVMPRSSFFRQLPEVLAGQA